MPLQETFWAARFGMLIDQFGAEERENVVAKYGAVEGANQTLDCLTEYLTHLNGSAR
jgi:hypothetical protein